MLLILMRHGIAENLIPTGDDFQRPLSPEGRHKTARAAAGLATFVPRADYLASSPKLRARQTAQLAQGAWGKGAPPLTQWPELLEESDFAPLRAKLCGLDGSAKTVVLVGHEPNLSRLAAFLLNGAVGFHWKKAGALGLEFDVVNGSGALMWFVPPKVLRALGR